MDLLSVQSALLHRVDEIASQLGSPWQWTIEKMVAVLSRYPQATLSVLRAEVDVMWHAYLNDRSKETTLREALSGKFSDTTAITSVPITSWDPRAGALTLQSEQASAFFYVLPHQHQFVSTFQKLLKSVTLIPSRLVSHPTAILFPTHRTLFHLLHAPMFTRPGSPAHWPPETRWISISKVESTDSRRATLYGNEKHADGSDHAAVITLRGDLVPMAKLFEEKRTYGFINLISGEWAASSSVDPSQSQQNVKRDGLYECSPETMYMSLQEQEVDSAVATNPSIPPTLIRSASLTSARTRTTIAALKPDQKNITLLGLVIAISDNRPLDYGTSKHVPRVALRITDASLPKPTDITCWEDLALAALALRPGQLVLLERLATGPGPGVRISASVANGTRVTAVSMLPAVLRSNWMQPRRRLAPDGAGAGAGGVDRVVEVGRTQGPVSVMRVTVVGVAVGGDKPLVICHRQCNHPLIRQVDANGAPDWCCKQCNQRLSASDLRSFAVPQYQVVWEVRDAGGQTLTCAALDSATADMVGLAATDMYRQSAASQMERLHQVVGRVFAVLIAPVLGRVVDPQAPQWRIDMVALESDVQGVV